MSPLGRCVGVSDAAYRVIVEGRPRPLTPIIRDEVYRIGREGLMNAFRHSGATHVEIELEYGVRDLAVFVRDDGRGVGDRRQHAHHRDRHDRQLEPQSKQRDQGRSHLPDDCQPA